MLKFNKVVWWKKPAAIFDVWTTQQREGEGRTSCVACGWIYTFWRDSSRWDFASAAEWSKQWEVNENLQREVETWRLHSMRGTQTSSICSSEPVRCFHVLKTPTLEPWLTGGFCFWDSKRGASARPPRCSDQEVITLVATCMALLSGYQNPL